MAKTVKHGLGRGLDALLGPNAPQTEVEIPVQAQPRTPIDLVTQLKISAIDPNREQPRRQFNEGALAELAESIKSVGIIQPIIVRRVNDRYQIIAGERRWRAARLAGLSEIPAIVRDWDSSRRLEVALVENLQRDDLNPIEQAAGIKRLMDQCGYTQEIIAERLGMSRPGVANVLRLLTLPEPVQEMLIGGQLSAGHARTLVPIESAEIQIKLAEHAVAQGLSVRQLERLVKELPKDDDEPKAAPIKRRDPAQVELERMARDVFGTKAHLDGDADKGKLVLHYFSSEDLQRIWDILESLNKGV